MDADGFMSDNMEYNSGDGYSDEELSDYTAENTTAAMEGYEDN